MLFFTRKYSKTCNGIAIFSVKKSTSEMKKTTFGRMKTSVEYCLQQEVSSKQVCMKN